MKNSLVLPLVVTFALSACGQTGPLYLPKDAPKVYDEPESKAGEAKKEKTTKTVPPPLPEKPEPQPGTTETTPEKSEPKPEESVLPPEKPELAPEK